MKTLIVEDNPTEQRLLHMLLSPLGPCDISIDGREAVQLWKQRAGGGDRYDLLCLDICLPCANGQLILREIRALERTRGVLDGKGTRVVMTTTLQDSDNVLRAFHEQCDGYLVKPIDRTGLFKLLHKLQLIAAPGSVGVA